MAGFNSTAFLAWAKRRGILTTAEGRRTIVSRIAGTPTNCVCLLKEQDFEPIDDDIPF